VNEEKRGRDQRAVADFRSAKHYDRFSGAMPVSLNASAHGLAAALIADAAALGIECHSIGGVQVVDCGVHAAGSEAAGVALARIAMAGQGHVAVSRVAGSALLGAGWPHCPYPIVTVTSDAAVKGCLAAQYAGWKVEGDGYFAMASGPVRAAIGRESIFDMIGHRERPDVAVGLLESSALPPADVCRRLATAAGVAPDRMILLVARTASPAGTLQVIARSLETALHKLHDIGFDLARIVRGRGAAPLAPVPAGPERDLVAIGRTNDAILYGGRVVLEVTGCDESLAEIGPRSVSQASPDYGASFLELFQRAGRDFYAVDPALFASAVIEFVNLDTGSIQRHGSLAPSIVARSFSAPDAPPVASGF
jgi:methenyltetrahydromethanopterin cyclohydrolase